jgi:DNA polymerase V
MTGAGIYPGDLLVVDRAVECDDGHIVIARIHDELTVKRLHLDQNGKFWLLAANDGYQPICIQDEDTEIWGRVLYSIKAL